MLTLELVAGEPDWMGALQVALALPEGVSERRSDDDPWGEPTTSRPRRISDDLSWLRAAVDEPEAHGLHEFEGTAAVAVWQAGEDSELLERFVRLDERGVLVAAGFQFRSSAPAV
jgi:hypothetical protein